MIPILFGSGEATFTSNGIGRLAEATKCEVTEERNGQYELVMEYPVTGKLMSSIQPGAYIFATHDESKTPEPFEIYQVSEPLEGVVTINAWHISYKLNNIIVSPYTASTCAAAIAGIPTNSLQTNPFTFWTDKSVTADFALTVPRSARAILGGTKGSLLDVYGTGEYEFTMFMVKLHLHRGTNRGVSIRYGKNLTSLDRTLDSSNQFNAVAPYWDGEGGPVYLDHLVVRTADMADKAIALDLTDSFDTMPTQAQLESAAQSAIDASDNYQIKENIKIDFVQLWQTTEYANFASLQRVYLCDTVNVFYSKLGINATAQCIRVVYDTLRERYIEMELGEPKTTLLQQITSEVSNTIMPQVPSYSSMEAAINYATELISGGYGGYIKYEYLSDGTPSEILIMDSPDSSTAVNIIRINQNGIGFSNTGINGPYTSAWTIDGSFVADFITAGTLDVARIATGSITSSKLDPSILESVNTEITVTQNGVAAVTNRLDNQQSYLRWDGSTSTLSIGESNSPTEAQVSPDGFAVVQNGEKILAAEGQKVITKYFEATDSMTVGRYQWIDEDTNGFSLLYTG